MSTTWSFNYIAITNEVELAKVLDACGIQQLMVDTENLGKAERQTGKNAVINFHQISDVQKLKSAGIKAKLICRINSYHTGSKAEIEQAINSGADAIMVPMITNMCHFNTMVQQIGQRVAILPLIETPYSIFKLNEIIETAKPTQLHFGLNDLHLALGMKNLFEAFLSPLFASAVAYARERVDLVGIGGVGDPTVPHKVDPELLINEHLLLGSRSTILSRSFFAGGYEIDRIQRSLFLIEKMMAKKPDEHKHQKLQLQIEKF